MDFKEYLVSKKVEDISTLDADKQAELYNEYNEASKKEIETLVAEKASSEEVEALRKKFDESLSTQYEALKALKQITTTQGTFMKNLDRGTSSSKVNALKSQLVENVEAFKKLKGSSNSNDNVKMTLKAVGDMSIAGNAAGVPLEDRVSGINEIKEREASLLNLVTVGSIGSNLKTWIYEANQEGVAGPTLEGALKNQNDFELLKGSADVEKITAFITITDEMLADVQEIQTLINNKLTVKVMNALEDGLYNGTGVSPQLTGIETVAPVFAAGSHAGTVDNANEVDVLQVAANQIKLAKHGRATGIAMHPTDVTSLLLAKVSSTDKRYIERLQMIAGTLSFDGVPIIESILVTEGEFLMGNFKMASLDYREGLKIEVGYNADNFVKNYKTIRAEVRAVVYVMQNDRGAFVTGVFATAKAALETP